MMRLTGSVLDPDPCPDPDWIRIQWSLCVGVRNQGPVFGRTKMAQKNKKQLINLIFGSAGCSLLRAVGLGISKLQFLTKERYK
jgi:hypothetical protein